MLRELEELVADLDWDDARMAVARTLGLTTAMPQAALRRAMVEDSYCHALFALRGNAVALARVIEDPSNRPYDMRRREAPPPTEVTERSAMELMGKAGAALVNWGASGFRTVDSAVREKRLGACHACPELADAPDRALYSISFSPKSDPRICNACGCVVSRKTRLATENCPLPSASAPELSRWGEPLGRRAAPRHDAQREAVR